MKKPPKSFASPAWAARFLQIAGLLAFVMLLAAVVPAWRPRVTPLLVIAFGVFWSLFGLFTFAFGWSVPRRGGGVVSPTQTRWLWLVIAFGTMFLGAACLFFGMGPLGGG